MTCADCPFYHRCMERRGICRDYVVYMERVERVRKELTAKCKCNPAKLPVPKLPPTKAVNIGLDKMNFVPEPEPPRENHKKGWTVKDERVLKKLKAAGVMDKDIAKKMGRTLHSIKGKVKALRRAGEL